MMKAFRFIFAFACLAPFHPVLAFFVAIIFCNLKNEWDDIL